MSKFVIELSENSASSSFLEFIRNLSFVKKVQAVSDKELDNRILRLFSSNKKSGLSDQEIISEIKKLRRSAHA